MTRSHPLSVPLAVFVGALSLTVGLAPLALAGSDGPCTTKKFNYPAVEAACKSGGQKAVKKLMKAAVKKAKASGEKMKCKSCHSDTKAWTLTDNAVADLKPWL